jgi:hypothetical protein
VPRDVEPPAPDARPTAGPQGKGQLQLNDIWSIGYRTGGDLIGETKPPSGVEAALSAAARSRVRRKAERFSTFRTFTSKLLLEVRHDWALGSRRSMTERAGTREGLGKSAQHRARKRTR